MSDGALVCTCGEPIRANAGFCAACGLEVSQPCPACGAERRWLATLAPGERPWCDNRQAIVYACERCGRWVISSALYCPDPDCNGRTLPTNPQHTGRRWDGRGDGAGWRWPERWEGFHPDRTAPRVSRWEAPDVVHAAFAAHGRLYVWAGVNLVAPEDAFGALGSPSPPAEADLTGASWRSALGSGASPTPRLSCEERVAVAGAGAIVATDRAFSLIGLYDRGESQRIEGGVPLAQVGGPAWWVGWTDERGTPSLRCAPVGETWDRLVPTFVETPPEAAPRGRLVLRDGVACWAGLDDAVWMLDCATRTVRQAVAPAEGLQQIWAEPDGPRIVREAQGRLSIGLGAPSEDRGLREVSAGLGPLRGVFATASYLVVVGERPVAFDARSGERLQEGSRVPGRWIAGALAGAADGEPRLLMLTTDAGRGQLSAIKISTGVEDLLWSEPDVEPLALIPVAGSLVIVCSRVLVRITETLV